MPWPDYTLSVNYTILFSDKIFGPFLIRNIITSNNYSIPIRIVIIKMLEKPKIVLKFKNIYVFFQ